MRRMPSDSQQSVLGFDYLAGMAGLLCIFMAFLLFTQMVDHNLPMAVKTIFAPILIFAAFTLHPAFLGGWHLKRVSVWDFTTSAVSGSAAFITLITLAAFRPLATIQLESALFYGNMAIAEEFCFGYFLFAWMLTFLDPLSASLVDAAIFSGYHLAVYGLNPWLLLFAFAARVVFCLVYRATGNLSAAIGPHVLINVLASGLFIVGV